jgi:hypothetical protein
MGITDKVDDYGAVALTWLTAEIGAIELALQEFTDLSLVATLPADLQPLAIAVVGIAATVALADDLGADLS